MNLVKFKFCIFNHILNDAMYLSCLLDAKKVDDGIFYLLRRKFCGELSEVSSRTARMNWPNLVLKYLDENLIWTRGDNGRDNPSENELTIIPTETPNRISCN